MASFEFEMSELSLYVAGIYMWSMHHNCNDLIIVVVVDGLCLTFGGIPERMASGRTSLIRYQALWQGLPSTTQRSNGLGQPSARTTNPLRPPAHPF